MQSQHLSSSYSLNKLIDWIPSKHHGHNFCVNEMVIEVIVLLQSHLFWSLMIHHSATASFFRVRAGVPPLTFKRAVHYIPFIIVTNVNAFEPT